VPAILTQACRAARRLPAALAAVLALVAACSDGVTSISPAPSASAVAPSLPRFDVATVTATATTAIVNAQTGQPCLTSSDPTGTVTAVVVVAPCSGAVAQQFVVPPVGTGGEIRLGAALCLDLWNAGRSQGDSLVMRPCSGASSQHWSLTATGALTGYTALCAGASSPLAGTRVTYWPCDGKPTKTWTLSSAPAPAPPPPPPAASLLVSAQLTNPCMASTDTSATKSATLALTLCTGATAQRFVVPATGVKGPIKLGASLCVDLSNGGTDGDSLAVRPCSGAATQQWTLTSAGQLQGYLGKCAAVTTSLSGTRVVYWGCVTAASRTWTPKAAGPLPAPIPAPPKLTGPAAVFGLMAATVPSVTAQVARGGVWTRYETDFTYYADMHWSTDSTSYNANFYDLAMIYYMWWARTGNATYLGRANQLAIAARTWIESMSFKPQPYLLMVDGVALHALLTGDARSAQAVARVADYYGEVGTGWHAMIGDSNSVNMDGRNQARVLSTLLDAWYLGVASPRGYDYGTLLRDFLTRILRTQSADGAYRFASQCYFHKPWMTGMLNDAMIRYYTAFEHDARITSSVKRSVDYMWANDRDAVSGQFRYLGGTCASSGEGPSLSGVNNSMLVSGFGFVERTTGDASYYTKGDAVFSTAVTASFLPNSKLFNEAYTSSYRYLAQRF
jgi:hypothetical protein